MKTSHTDRIIEEIAKRHGTSCEEVRSAIESAISHGRSSLEPHAQCFWDALNSEDSDHELETLLHALSFLAVLIHRNSNI